jgi:UDPglucose 6-dehydrogenase
MRIGVIGAGTVGVVSGTCLADTGNDVVVFDVDQKKIQDLRSGNLPFFETGLEELLRKNTKALRLQFSKEPKEAIANAQVVFIAVDTPPGEDQTTNLSRVWESVELIARHAAGPLVVAVKSTVPVGTTRKIKSKLSQGVRHPIHVAYAPVFLQEGRMLEDFFRPDWVLIGLVDEEAREVLDYLHAPYLRTNNPILFMDATSAEVTKLSVSALLASRISFMNEIANLCDAAGADIHQVRMGVGADSRIKASFLNAGIGYGGRRFPKDVLELLKAGEEAGLSMDLLRAVNEVNERQQHLLAERVRERLGSDLSGRTLAVWGLSFKAETDDVRASPALVIVKDLENAGAAVRVYDPEAMEQAKGVLGGSVCYCGQPYEALEGADALVVATEWNEFRRPDAARMKALLKQPLIFDGRNLYDPKRWEQMGFVVVGVGRGRRG